MILIGLTGGIASGKSTVSRLLAERGAVVVDADLLAREVVEPGTPGLAAVVAAFGPEVLQADGSLDRAALGGRVFADPAELARLNAVVHPLVAARTAERFAAARAAGAAVVVHDVPLLVENALAGYDAVVVVDADPATQLDRLVRLRGMAPEQARQRIAAQASRTDRLAIATHTIRNDGAYEDLLVEVDGLWAALVQGAG
jgi:dephospho-CoA kinase